MSTLGNLKPPQVLSAAPTRIRVSVLGDRTQLDVSLPVDVDVAILLPELVAMIGSREAGSDPADDDGPQAFWVLEHGRDAAVLAPADTLRTAGVRGGDVLRLRAQPALVPPTRYDDVVEAAARLTRASYPPWSSAAAGVLGVAGLWACAATWVYLVVTLAHSAQRGALIAGAAATGLALVAGAVLAGRGLGRADIAVATGGPAIAVGAALCWTLGAPYSDYGLAATGLVLLVLTGVCRVLIGSGAPVFNAAALLFAFTAGWMLCLGAGAPVDVAAVLVTITATLSVLGVPRVSARLDRVPRRPIDDVASPFDPPAADLGAAVVPTADEIAARVRAAALARAGLTAGLSAIAVVGAAVLVHTRIGWTVLGFAMLCAAVLALRARKVRSVAERAVLAVCALALTVTVCVEARAGGTAMGLAGLAALGTVLIAASVAGSITATAWRQRISTAAGYLEYLAVASLIPVTLWLLVK